MFFVYEVVFNNKDGSIVEQVEVKSIGVEALFLGAGHSVSVLASNFLGCKPNSIYDTYNDVPYFEHAGRQLYHIFSLEDPTVAQYVNYPRHLQLAGGVWILPMFN